MSDFEDEVLAWLGLAIAVVLLQSFGWGKLARYTLLAVIFYGLLTNIEKFGPLVDRWIAGVSLATKG